MKQTVGQIRENLSFFICHNLSENFSTHLLTWLINGVIFQKENK